MLEPNNRDFRFNVKAKYYCKTGYRIYGNNARVCKEDGFWSGTVPVCVGKFLFFCFF